MRVYAVKVNHVLIEGGSDLDVIQEEFAMLAEDDADAIERGITIAHQDTPPGWQVQTVDPVPIRDMMMYLDPLRGPCYYAIRVEPVTLTPDEEAAFYAECAAEEAARAQDFADLTTSD